MRVHRVFLLTLLLALAAGACAFFAPSVLRAQMEDGASVSDEMLGNGSGEPEDGQSAMDPPLPPHGDETVHENGSVTLRLGPANVQTFNIPTLEGMARGFVKLSGVDMTDDRLIDDFAAINYCRIFASYYPNEFIWQQARRAIRKVMERDLETYPETFVINGKLPLGRYDFTTYSFELKTENKMEKTGLFDLRFELSPQCGLLRRLVLVPANYTIRLDNPVTLDQIPVAGSLAKEIVSLMDRNENYRRETFVSFYIRINDFSAVERLIGLTADVRATLLAMRLYADSKRSLLIYDYRPRAIGKRR